MDKLRIIFMGTPDFAVGSLSCLVENGCNVVGVVTAPDKPAGRGQKLRKSAVKLYAEKHELKIWQPTNLKDEDFINEIKAAKPDIQVVVAFRMLPEAVWRIPINGTFNLHASLLPQYRGAAPINWAIINGEKETGVTTFFIDEEIDTGKIIFQQKVPISNNDTAGILHDRLMQVGAKLVLKTVQAIEEDNYSVSAQSEYFEEQSELKPAPKIFKTDCRINWNQPVDVIYNHIQGLNPFPTAHTELLSPNDVKHFTKIFAITKEYDDQVPNPGIVESDGKTYMKVSALDGFISINEIQTAGKRRMKIEDFLRGFDISGNWQCI